MSLLLLFQGYGTASVAAEEWCEIGPLLVTPLSVRARVAGPSVVARIAPPTQTFTRPETGHE